MKTKKNKKTGRVKSVDSDKTSPENAHDFKQKFGGLRKVQFDKSYQYSGMILAY